MSVALKMYKHTHIRVNRSLIRVNQNLPRFMKTSNWSVAVKMYKHTSSIIKADQRPFLTGREGTGGGAHILRGRTLIRISCPDLSNSVRTPRDVHYSGAHPH